MRRTLLLVPALGLAASLAFAGPAHAQGATALHTDLTGAAEEPGPGDPDGFGFARVIAIPSQDLVCYVIRVKDIGPATAAHIHEAPEGEAGPVVVTLAAPTNGVSAGCVEGSGEAADIAADPADYYVNVHNADFPGGALRGQLG